MINRPPWITSSCQAFSHREKKGNSFHREYKRPFWQCSTSWPCRWLHEYIFCLNMLRILARFMWVYPNYIRLKLIKRGDWRRKRRKINPDWIKLHHSHQLIFWHIKRVKLCRASCAEDPVVGSSRWRFIVSIEPVNPKRIKAVHMPSMVWKKQNCPLP